PATTASAVIASCMKPPRPSALAFAVDRPLRTLLKTKGFGAIRRLRGVSSRQHRVMVDTLCQWAGRTGRRIVSSKNEGFSGDKQPGSADGIGLCGVYEKSRAIIIAIRPLTSGIKLPRFCFPLCERFHVGEVRSHPYNFFSSPALVRTCTCQRMRVISVTAY